MLRRRDVERISFQSDKKVVIKVALDDGAPSMELVYEKGTHPGIAAETFIKVCCLMERESGRERERERKSCSDLKIIMSGPK